MTKSCSEKSELQLSKLFRCVCNLWIWLFKLCFLIVFFSCLNPIIYGFMSKNFRQSFTAQLKYFCGFSYLRRGNWSPNAANSPQNTTVIICKVTQVFGKDCFKPRTVISNYSNCVFDPDILYYYINKL